MNTGRRVIFILGISARSGTNFLANLLVRHPDCDRPARLGEDFLLANSEHLARFSDGVYDDWNGRWGVTPEDQQELDRALGAGLCSFLGQRTTSRVVVSKTPGLEGLEQFFRFFPDASLLILVRDGRAIVESGMRSFNWRREGAIHAVAGAAARINRFRHRKSIPNNRYRIVRFEDLWLNPEKEMRRLMGYLGLDPEIYDFASLDELPVVGSSETAREGGKVSWQPVKKADGFDPLSRFEHWDGWRHYRYNRIAGPEMAALGYEMDTRHGRHWTFALRSASLDLAWAVWHRIWPLYQRLKHQTERDGACH